MPPRGEFPTIPPDSILSMSLVFYGFMYFLAVIIAWLREAREFINPCTAEALFWGALLGLAVAILSRPLKWFAAFDSMYKVLGKILGPQDAWTCAALALSSGFAEEALFRGALQPWFGIYVTAALFGLVHSPVLLPDDAGEIKEALGIWPLFAFVVGLAFGYLTIYTKTWLSAAAAHGMVNYLNLRFICGNEALHAGSGTEDDSGIS